MSQDERAPHVVVLGGPNGAGKSTVAPRLVRDALGVTTFVNADEIARGLSGFAPETAALRAGLIMLARLRELTDERVTFAFESTLAGLGMRDVLTRCRAAEYQVHIFYLWLSNPDMALARVQARVAAGGHDIPDADVRRRWGRSLTNSFDHYMPLATTWRLYDGNVSRPRIAVARGGAGLATAVHDPVTWRVITAQQEALHRGEPIP